MVALSAVLVVGIAITATILAGGQRGCGGGEPELAKAFVCTICKAEGKEVSFNNNPDLATHMKEEHGGFPPEETIAKSVGMVICGFKVTKNGSVEERMSLWLPIETKEFASFPTELKEQCDVSGGKIYLHMGGGTGSCFVITEDGYAITNMHVVEDVHKKKDASGLGEYVKRTVVTTASRAIWVALDEVVHQAKIIYVSNQYDCAIIKIEGLSGLPTWKLSEAEELKRNVEVATLGFPGSSQIVMNAEEAALKRAKAENAKSIRDFFLDSDFQYVQKKGSVSVVKERAGEGVVVEHTATINGGNSGGPLVRTGDGVVAGLNTWYSKKGANTFLSIKIDSVKKEIDQFVPNAVWVD
jgi:hypothetical protein